jgi:hypothetical protein
MTKTYQIIVCYSGMPNLPHITLYVEAHTEDSAHTKALASARKHWQLNPASRSLLEVVYCQQVQKGEH